MPQWKVSVIIHLFSAWKLSSSAALVRATFESILDIIASLGLHRASPKFFIVYAHDNDKLRGYNANAAVVKDFIGWFKKIQFDVDSDRSPHGLVQGRGPEIEGASSDIIKNQLCLLPGGWDGRNVDYVLVFGSELLGKYMDDERNIQLDGLTYTRALFKALTEPDMDGEKKQPEELVRGVQRKYVVEMGELFHHVLTEVALVDFRNRNGHGKSHRTIPVLLGGDHKTCFPESIDETMVRVDVNHKTPYKSLFKILLMFEELEEERLLIEALKLCFDRCVDILQDGKRDSLQRQRECATIILATLREQTHSEERKGTEMRTVEAVVKRLEAVIRDKGRKYDSSPSSLTNDC